VGRKKTLITTLSLMGGATMLMGLLPDFSAIGIWAPILLTTLRLIQGLALGGVGWRSAARGRVRPA
jgi:MFS family permease